MKPMEIWCEGDPKRDLNACHLGYAKGESLLAACMRLATENNYFSKVFNPKTLTYAGCRIFDNEAEARELYN